MGDGNTSFREHDIEYLQKRTKLWLEATLGETYGDRTLADLIADGNVLYRVSKSLTKEITGASPGPQEISAKTLSEVSAYGKKSGKYLPYANVDTFLKTCRRVGLTDVELFTPPDAVEGKDIRRVCTSIRSLARKARNQLIRVPDFEDVNRPLPMPKEKVGGIKENLQHSTSSLANSMAANNPEAEIQKSERVQIISRFLSATRSPEHPTSEEGVSRSPSIGSASPATPSGAFQSSLSFSSVRTPSPSTPALTKSASVTEPSSVGPNPLPRSRLESSFSGQNPSPEDPSGQEKLQPSLSSGAERVERSDSSTPSSTPSFPRKSLGSFRHAQPHFIISSSQSKPSDLADYNLEGEDPAAASAAPSSARREQRSGDLEKISSKSGQPAADGQSRDMSSLSKAYRHAQPHFSFKKTSSQDVNDDLYESRVLQPKASKGELDDTDPSPKAAPPPSARPNKARSSNKIVENDPKSSLRKSEPPPPSPSPKTSSKGSAKLTTGSQGTTAGHTKEPLNNHDQPQSKGKGGPGFQFNSKLWVPILAGALAFLGTFLVTRKRSPSEYEVKQGDTLSKISKHVGKEHWDELVKLNPNIINPHLIYPSDRIRLPSEKKGGRTISTLQQS